MPSWAALGKANGALYGRSCRFLHVCSILHLQRSFCCSLQCQVGAKQETEGNQTHISLVQDAIDERMGFGAVRVNSAMAHVSEAAFLFKMFKDICCLAFGVWRCTMRKQQCCLHVWLPMGGAWEREDTCEIVTSFVPTCIQTFNILPRNSQVVSAQTFFMSMALVSFFFDKDPFIPVASWNIDSVFFARFIVACMWQVGQWVWLSISDVSVNMFK